jgi:hypothetical protein
MPNHLFYQRFYLYFGAGLLNLKVHKRSLLLAWTSANRLRKFLFLYLYHETKPCLAALHRCLVLYYIPILQLQPIGCIACIACDLQNSLSLYLLLQTELLTLAIANNRTNTLLCCSSRFWKTFWPDSGRGSGALYQIPTVCMCQTVANGV